ncbi:hypothetical protein BCR36DRAFT_415284 [Piromyces finnis]|uniref:Tubby C-terminal domain-containing protein n=1 Tax=Piromyces finnis TaxID=1754191 RepID=A0A1Y1UZ70_9FUNG|nr:hypothetical protein BCR36DRAFT_415284 [Piromyces finnis]|eukprot:ORX43923.1 hypothetical protein BCR36DRAFT_415284 [Piromyces finnis]
MISYSNSVLENPGHDISVMNKSISLPERFLFKYEGYHLANMKYSLKDMSDRKLYKFKMNILKDITCLSDIKHHSLFKMTMNSQGNDRKKLVIHSKKIDKFIVSLKKGFLATDNNYTIAYYNKMKKRTENFNIYENDNKVEIYYGNKKNGDDILICKAEKCDYTKFDYLIKIAPKIDKTFLTLIIINLINKKVMAKEKSNGKCSFFLN